ncbi:hypothetical protein CkaCkLH20_07648 [Colletotrichum karsti]|uniref:Uncharacterized protein n=1 Tax=Colletotrichum karsti TaxID=1095194 RepID=A0A9P6I2C0_9PEZI|nr:uncharacterized protein CkaCkLH20_07648 [Colletotrichum karsti]KAF9874954.1 hypothetical protein CkaCkLH20_07648 [Colletotrichum karsti]
MRVSVLTATLALVAHSLAQEATCYAPNGNIADNETYVPCNKLGINQRGVFSSCCALDGEPDQRDICSSSGLCINRQQQPQRGFCTDPTWKSKACISVCMDEQSGGSASNSTIMTACNDGTATYCCGASNTTCCGTDHAIKIQTQESVCTANMTDDASGGGGDAFKGATIGLAVVAGVCLLAGLLSTFWLWKQNKSLKRQLSEKPEPSPPAEPHTPAQTLVEPQTTGSDIRGSYAASSPGLYKPPYSTSPRESEFHHGNIHRYSELDASVATARSEMGSPTPYDQTHFSQPGRDSPIPENNGHGGPMDTPYLHQR